MSEQKLTKTPDVVEEIEAAREVIARDFAKLKPEEVANVIETLEKQLDRDQGWLKHFDFKLGPILAADGLLIGMAAKLLGDYRGAFYSQRDPNVWGGVAFTVGTCVTVFLLGLSVVYGILAISPKLSWRELNVFRFSREALTHDIAPATQVYFDHLASYGTLKALAEGVLQTYPNPARYGAQLLQQVKANAEVARDKAKQVRWSIKFLFLGILMATATALSTVVLWGMR